MKKPAAEFTHAQPSSSFRLITAEGIPFRVALVLSGKSADENVASEPLIQFFDMRHWPEKGGQKVSSYHLSTFLESDAAERGLNLDGGVADWTLDPASVKAVIDWVHTNPLPTSELEGASDEPEDHSLIHGARL
ncbi:hypothetical protein ACEOSU_19715 [Pseudomonas aeruginosa]